MNRLKHTLVNFFRGLFWVALAIFAVPYFLMTTSAGMPVLVAHDTEVSTLPIMKFANDPIYKGSVVDALDSNVEGKRYRLIRSYSAAQGYCPASAIIDLSEVSDNDTDVNHIVILDSEKTVSPEDDSLANQDKIVETCKDLVSFSSKNPFSGVYLTVSPDTDWAFYADYMEQLHIPYGYIVKSNEYDSLNESSAEFIQNVSFDNSYEEYNILPLVFDITAMHVSSYSINNLYDSLGDDVIIKDDEEPIDNGRGYWTESDNEFANSQEFAKKLKLKETKIDTELEYIELNTESYYTDNFISERSTLMEK